MATVPLSGTNIRLLSGVPFNNDYKNTRWFDNQSAQTSYFQSKPVVHSESSHNFQRTTETSYMRVEKSKDDLWNANYLMFQNASYSNKWFYAFITRLEYVNRRVTNVHFQIDVFQTWRFAMNFKPSFVVREHCSLWNSNGSPVVNTMDEGLDYGTEYDTVSVEKYHPLEGYKWLIIVAKNALHTTDKKPKPSVIGIPQPLSYYMVPFKDNGQKTPTVIIDGNDYPITPPDRMLEELYKDTDAVNNIVSLYVTEWTGIDCNLSQGTNNNPDVITFPTNQNKVVSVSIGDSLRCVYVEKAPRFNAITKSFGNKYKDFTKPKESKLMMYPYMVTIVDDFKGNRVEYRNEYINHTDFRINFKGSLGLSNKTTAGVIEYNADGVSHQGQLSNENALINNSPADVPVLSDHLASYIQGNRNSIQNQQMGILFNNFMNLFGGGMPTISSASRGNTMGTLTGAGNMVTGFGNSVLALQAISARQKDINNIPPNISKQGSNTAYEYGNGYEGIYVIKKQIKPEYRKKLQDFFGMFGYKVNEVKVPNFHTRQHFNYVQTESCTITGNINNEDITELKQIFDNGITLWHTDDIGNYSLTNGVI